MFRILAALSVVGLLFNSGCVVPQTATAYAGLVTNNVKGPVAGVDNSVRPVKTGVAESKGILFFASGDASISAAMAAGGITKVHHVDNEVFSILNLYVVTKTIVYGE